MVTVKNELSRFPTTQTYVDFGLAQVERMNSRFREWVTNQTFASQAEESLVAEMVVRGSSESYDQEHKPYSDRVEWSLHFPKKVENKNLDHALLVEPIHNKNRLPDGTTFNSAPQIFPVADYVGVSVYNGEQGWVKKGEFPVNVHLEMAQVNPDNIREGMKQIPVQTDIRREALARFEAAYQWQRFRAMAVSSVGYLEDYLKREWQNLPEKERNWEAGEWMRSRKQTAYEFWVAMLPDTRREEGPTALKSFYHPGALEAVLALELEKTVVPNFGGRRENRVLSSILGSPIEIIPTSAGYDAFMKFRVTLLNSFDVDKDETLKPLVQELLGKHYTVEVQTPTQYNFTFEIKDAHRVEEEIRNGSETSSLRTEASKLVDNLRIVYEALNQWHEQKMPALQADYETRVAIDKTNHFLEYGKRIS